MNCHYTDQLAPLVYGGIWLALLMIAAGVFCMGVAMLISELRRIGKVRKKVLHSERRQ